MKKIKFQILTNMDPHCYYWTSRAAAMDDLRFRLNFNLSKKNEIYHHS